MTERLVFLDMVARRFFIDHFSSVREIAHRGDPDK